MSNVDSLDRAILSFLRESARAPYVEIAVLGYSHAVEATSGNSNNAKVVERVVQDESRNFPLSFCLDILLSYAYRNSPITLGPVLWQTQNFSAVLPAV